jgi:hypothetical protein
MIKRVGRSPKGFWIIILAVVILYNKSDVPMLQFLFGDIPSIVIPWYFIICSLGIASSLYGIWYSWSNLRYRRSNVVVKDINKATYYRGKLGSKFPSSKKFRNQVWNKNPGRCAYTGVKMWKKRPTSFLDKLFDLVNDKDDNWDMDHIIPENCGGPGEMWNALPASVKYNRGIGDRIDKKKWAQLEPLLKRRKETIHIDCFR